MPIKSRRYRKRNNKSHRTRKNKTTRRYKKQMKGGFKFITSQEELKKSWDDREDIFWEVNDGRGVTKYIYSEDLTSYEDFENKMKNYLNSVKNRNKGAYILKKKKYKSF